MIAALGAGCAGGRKCAIVSDENVAPLYMERLEKSLAKAGLSHDHIVMPAGEATKSFPRLEEACDRLLAMEVERGDLIIALGGGVIGDFAGFSAAILRRGMDFVQIPTSLLAQVDSSVGGKTGINSRLGKNLIGAFHQPRLVIIDIDTLDTLPPRELAAGYAEIVKYGLIDDKDFFVWLEDNGPRLLEGDSRARARAIAASCRAKARIVAMDERESGCRALLNLGHTFGHALEAWAGYDGTLLHGEAISIGMVNAFELSARLGYCSPGDGERVEKHLRKAGLPTRISHIRGDEGPGAQELLRHMAQDKKVSGGKLVFIMTKGIGESFIDKEVPIDKLEEYLREQCQSRS
jgi:3-dehydroquinate synthase